MNIGAIRAANTWLRFPPMDNSQFQWASVVVPAAAALVGAIIGGLFALGAASKTAKAVAEQALESQRDEREHQNQAARDRAMQHEKKHRRELLAHAVRALLEVLWTKERRLCAALDIARNSPVVCPPGIDDEALQLLGALDLEVHADLLQALPFIIDAELKKRLRTAQAVVNSAYNLRATGPRFVTHEEYSRAMLDVQRYFKWLRWNLDRALAGERLPVYLAAPDLRRPGTEPEWPIPGGIPDHI